MSPHHTRLTTVSVVLIAVLIAPLAGPASAQQTADRGCPDGLRLLETVGCVRDLADGLVEFVTEDGFSGLTHGPDRLEAAPATTAVATQREAPTGWLAAATALLGRSLVGSWLLGDDADHDHSTHDHGSAGVAANTGSGSMDGVPKRAPRCMSNGKHRFVILYAHETGTRDALTDRVGAIRRSMARSNGLLDRSARDSAPRHADLKTKCWSGGKVAVRSVASDGRDFGDIIDAARDARYTSGREKYMVFADFDAPAPGIAGQAMVFPDETATSDNRNNGGSAMYGVAYRSAWNTPTPLHEMGHLMGGVQKDAPQADGRYHCSSAGDVLCSSYGNGSGCSKLTFDCGFDSYFSLSTKRGQWLHDHWNLGSRANRFLRIQPKSDGESSAKKSSRKTKKQRDGKTANRKPTARFEVSCTTQTCTFDSRRSGDPDGRIKARRWFLGDGTRVGGKRARHWFEKPGTYTVRLKVVDNDGAKAWKRRKVTVTNEAPEAVAEVDCDAEECTFDASESTDTDGRIVAYRWRFGDGSRDTGRTVTHTYDERGDYDARLVVVDNDRARGRTTTEVEVCPGVLGVAECTL